MVSVISGAGKIFLPNLPLSEASTPERLIVGIGAGLSLWIDAGDFECCIGGFGTYAGIFLGVLILLVLKGQECWGRGK